MPRALTIGDRVSVYSFGTHPGVITCTAPVVTIQGRDIQPAGWVRVRLDDGRTWNGTAQDVAFRSASPVIPRAALRAGASL